MVRKSSKKLEIHMTFVIMTVIGRRSVFLTLLNFMQYNAVQQGSDYTA